MKRAYVRPTMVGERFVANEYVAACSDTEYGKYKFTCDAGGGVSGDVYRESNGKPGFQKGYGLFGYGGDEWLGGYHACGTTHVEQRMKQTPQMISRMDIIFQTAETQWM